MSRFDRLGRVPRILLMALLYLVIGLVTAAFALQATFPYDRVKDRIVETLSSKYDTQIGSIERGIIPGRMTLHDIKLTTRPAKADDPKSVLFIKSLEVRVGLMALVGQDLKINLDAEIPMGSRVGSLTGYIAVSKTNTSIHLVGSKLPAPMLPMRELLGLPMSQGSLDFTVNLELPTEKQKGAVKATPNWQKAVGSITLKCPSLCTIGDGHSRLKTKIQNASKAAFAANGIEIGTINVSTLALRVDIKKGVMTLSQLDTKSDDITLQAELSILLAPNLDDSDVTGCLRFAGTDALLKREDKTYTALGAATGAPYGPDKLYHIKLEGKFRDIKKRPMLCGPGIDDQNMDDGNGRTGTTAGNSRPNLVVPVEPTSPPGVGTGVTAPATVPINPPPPEVTLPDAGILLDAAVVMPQPPPEGDGRYAPSNDGNQQPPPPPPPEGYPPPPGEGQPPPFPVDQQQPPVGEQPQQQQQQPQQPQTP